VVAWKDYFQQKFPDLNIICFTSFPKDPEEIKQMEIKGFCSQFKIPLTDWSA
jgi:hypothetical protein